VNYAHQTPGPFLPSVDPFRSHSMPDRTALFAYDIHDHRLRRQALRTVREWRVDGQLSVHECRLSAAEASRVFQRLNAGLDPAHDRLLLAWVQAQRPILARGRGRATVATTGLLWAA
jgi:CRISPR-associated protein Cas2